MWLFSVWSKDLFYFTSMPGAFPGSKPSQTSMTNVSPVARKTLTASVWVMPSRLWLPTSRILIPTFRRPSRAAAPLELTYKQGKKTINVSVIFLNKFYFYFTYILFEFYLLKLLINFPNFLNVWLICYSFKGFVIGYNVSTKISYVFQRVGTIDLCFSFENSLGNLCEVD